MAYKIFLDINILIDLLDEQRLHHSSAVELIHKAENNICLAHVTESVLNTTAYLIRKDYPPAKLIALFNHLLSFTQVIPVDTITYSAGLQKAVNDIEDAVIYAAALKHKLDFFITNDLKDFKKLEQPYLPIVQAKSFLQHI
jgi:predicted nucleic acid-binding protein